MKKMVYFIIIIMALVGLVNISAGSKDSKLLLNSNNGVLEINPVY